MTDDGTPRDDEAIREALDRALAERAAMLAAAMPSGPAMPPGDTVPDAEPGRLWAPVPGRGRQD